MQFNSSKLAVVAVMLSYLWWNGIWNESYMNCGYEINWSYDLRSYERNFYNCVEKPEKFRTSTGFEPVTSRFRCDALTNWAMKPLTLGVGHLWVLMDPWGMNQWWNGIWNESYELQKWNQVKLWSSQLWTQFLQLRRETLKFRTSTGFEPVNSRFRCDALTNWTMKPLTLGAGHLWVLMVPWGMNQWWNGIWNEFHWFSGFIAQLARASHRNREVTGSNSVEVLNFSGFSTQM